MDSRLIRWLVTGALVGCAIRFYELYREGATNVFIMDDQAVETMRSAGVEVKEI